MSNDNSNQLGEAIKAQRAHAGYTVRQLAQLSGVTASTVFRLETGQIDAPKLEHLQRLARALDIEVEDFYALAGYLIPEGLPELRPYLRAKYGLPERAARQLDEYFQALRGQWDGPQKEGNHGRGDNNINNT